MICMARKETSDGKVQGNSLPEIRAGMKAAALRVARRVPREGRPIEEGPMLSRLAAWFLLLDDDDKVRIIRDGHAVIEYLAEADAPPEALDAEAAQAVRATLGPALSSVPAVPAANDDASGLSPVVFAEGGELPASKGHRKRSKPKN